MTDRVGMVGGGAVIAAYPHQSSLENQTALIVRILSMLEGVVGAGGIVPEKEDGSCDPTFGEVVRECPKLVRASGV